MFASAMQGGHNQCLLFATQADTITACFAVVPLPRLYHLFLVTVLTLYF